MAIAPPAAASGLSGEGGRPRQGRVLAGVGAWMAARLGMPVLVVRAALVALIFVGGVGAAIYILVWILVPGQGPPGWTSSGSSDPPTSASSPSSARSSRPGNRPAASSADTRQALAVAMVVVGLLLMIRSVIPWFDDGLVWPAAVVGAGMVVLWRQVDRRPQAQALARLAGRRDLRAGARVAAGAGLVAAGMGLFLAANDALEAARQGLLAISAVVSGTALVFAPWWVKLGRELSREREARIRSQERAEVAAHIHDSVLQTLALIQRNSTDGRVVASLARRQERELRSWLFGRPRDPGGEERPSVVAEPAPTAPGADGGLVADGGSVATPAEAGPPDGADPVVSAAGNVGVLRPAATLAGSVAAMAADVEDRHGVRIEVVCVGDIDTDVATADPPTADPGRGDSGRADSGRGDSGRADSGRADARRADSHTAGLADGLESMVAAAREALVNAATHSGVTDISVYVEVEVDRVSIFVRDRGSGFDPEAVADGHSGIVHSIVGRMHRRGGQAHIHTGPGGGTEVELVLPRRRF
ncbi:MAG: PspC domain-containing protein [Acidimicrobiales bacterium]